MFEFEIRTAIPGDENFIHEAHMRSIREICVKAHGAQEIQGWGFRPLGNRWIESIKNGHVWVVESVDGIFGHAYIKILAEAGESKAHIHGLYLTPEVVGHGIGRKLGELMLATARNADVKIVTLESTLTAHGFYRHLGFADVGLVQTMTIGGFPVRYIPMSILLK
jgi:GNAT superfamily N-acetyltransferase